MRCEFCWQEKENVIVSEGTKSVVCYDCVRIAKELVNEPEPKTEVGG